MGLLPECRSPLFEMFPVSAHLRLAPSLCSVLLLSRNSATAQKALDLGLLPGFDFCEQRSADVVLHASKGVSKEDSWEREGWVTRTFSLTRHARPFSRGWLPVYTPSGSGCAFGSATARRCPRHRAFSFLPV
uniref:Uncharacterized protein n=1 Tax=Molossus molossus TaxID=27622 RepID=A0A7J8ESN3_MOLMO|nr:hypothetical protein HJG59_008742 [Molossus molossus]